MAKSLTNTQVPMGEILLVLADTYPDHPMDDITQGDPYKVLVACIMSLRTKDDMTIPLAKKLFETVDTPEKMVQLTQKEVEQKIYPVGFYKTKATNILALSQRLIDEYNSQVPDDIDELLTFKGVGRKTANLVVGLGFKKPAVCVDVHVHRISNRLGYLTTKDPEETEWEIRAHLDKKYWRILNKVLVRHGQECCKPIGPECYRCPVEGQCQKVEVKPRQPKASSK